MAIKTKAEFSGLYFTSNGSWPDNTTGEITPLDLRNGMIDYFDSQNSFWFADTSGILGADAPSGLRAIDFASGLSAPEWREGRVFYDANNHAFNTYLDIPDVILQLGQETYIRVVNKTSSPIPNGMVVSITGAHGNRPTIEPAIASPNYPYHCDVIGITTHQIEVNQEGLVTVRGTVNMDTSSFGDGSRLFLSPTISGALQIEEPNAPNITIQLGWALNTTLNGKVLVNPEHNCTLEQLSDVNGHIAFHNYILAYNEVSGYWDKTDRLNTSGGFKFGDVDSGNYTEFQEDTGFSIAYGSSIGWNDLRFPASTLNPTGGASDADVDIADTPFIGTLLFNSDTTEIICGQAQMPHSWAIGTELRPHVHWCPTNTNTGNVYWQFDYQIANVNGTFPGTYTTLTSIDAADGITNKHQLASFGSINMSGYLLSSMLLWRLSRIGGNGVDTYNADARLLEVDFHYRIDSCGSRQEFIK